MTSPWSPQHAPQPYGQGHQQPTPPASGTNRAWWWAIGAGVVVVVVLVAVIVLPFGDDPSPNPGDVERPQDVADTDLRPGNCLEAMETVRDNLLRLVPCSAPHASEVVSESTITDEDFDSEEAYREQSEEICTAETQDIVPDDMDSEAVNTHSFFPTQDTWRDGDRLITCLVAVEAGHHLTGSFIAGDVELHSGSV